MPELVPLHGAANYRERYRPLDRPLSGLRPAHLAPLLPADRALHYRLRKLGVIGSVEDERAKQREGEAQERDGPPKIRTLRRGVSAAKKAEWLATQPIEVHERQRDVHEFNLLLDKWVAFRNAWNGATPHQQHRLEEKLATTAARWLSQSIHRAPQLAISQHNANSSLGQAATISFESSLFCRPAC